MSVSRTFGRPLRRREDSALLTGKGAYLADCIEPGMAAMRVIRSTVPHGRISAIDFSHISARPDCLGVLAGADLPPGIGVLPAMDLVADSAAAHQTVLARQRVRYVGEPVAVVLGTDAYVAEDLAEQVIVRYEPLAAVRNVHEGIQDGAALLYPEIGSNIVHQTTQCVGDPGGAFAAAARVIEQTFHFPRAIAGALELRGAIAKIEPSTGRYLVYSSTQIPQLLRSQLARITGIPLRRLRVVAPQVGGGFGSKEAIYPEEILVLLALQKFARPVYWLEDRQESFSATVHGREETMRLRVAVQADGTITALEADCLADIGAAYSLFSNTPGAAVATVRGPYRIPNFRSRARSVVTNKTPLNVYRGAGHPQAVLSMERMMDLAAAATGLDRAQIRHRNLLAPEVFPVDRGVGYPGCGRIVFDSGDFPALLRSTLEAIDYRGFSRRRSQAAPGLSLGLGMAFVVEMTGGGGDEPARVRLSADGRLQLLSGITPIGQGSATVLTQILADHLALPVEMIEFIAGDTNDVPDAPGTFASRGAMMGGNAACRAGDAFIHAARRLAAEVCGANMQDIVWSNGLLIDRNRPNESLSLASLALRAEARGMAPHIRLDVTARFEDTGIGFASACHAAVVEVDRGTGAIRVLDFAVTHDCGRVANPLLVDGQIIGGVVQGLGGCLFEALQFDATGMPLTLGFMDYVLPTAASAPRFALRHIETPSPLNPLGMKGAGEAGCSGALGAIFNAIADALGPDVTPPAGSGPFTPELIRKLLRMSRQQGASPC
jgi:carbon-monoxide dehydrogenase large subunit